MSTPDSRRISGGLFVIGAGLFAVSAAINPHDAGPPCGIVAAILLVIGLVQLVSAR